MGFVSRRFEWQADAYAAGLLSRVGQDGVVAGTITPEASRTVGDALERAAVLNGADPRAFSWRHGSIASRQRRVRALAGRDAGRLPVDRAANLLKAAIVAAWGVIGWLVLSPAGGGA